MKTLAVLLAASSLLTGCLSTQRAPLHKGMTFWETQHALNPVTLKNTESTRSGDTVTEKFLVESYPCPAEPWTYRLTFVDGKLDRWLETQPTGPASFECHDHKTVVVPGQIRGAK